jgi:hypothetical protein
MHRLGRSFSPTLSRLARGRRKRRILNRRFSQESPSMKCKNNLTKWHLADKEKDLMLMVVVAGCHDDVFNYLVLK